MTNASVPIRPPTTTSGPSTKAPEPSRAIKPSATASPVPARPALATTAGPSSIIATKTSEQPIARAPARPPNPTTTGPSGIVTSKTSEPSRTVKPAAPVTARPPPPTGAGASVPKAPRQADAVSSQPGPTEVCATPSTTPQAVPTNTNLSAQLPSSDGARQAEQSNKSSGLPAAMVATLNEWRRTALPKSYVELPGAIGALYKDANRVIKMFTVNPGQVLQPPSWVEIEHRDRVVLAEDGESFRCVPYPSPAVPVQQPAAVGGGSSSVNMPAALQPQSQPQPQPKPQLQPQPTMTKTDAGQPLAPVTPKNANDATTGRSPAQADKARLAKDILRSLSKGKARKPRDNKSVTEPKAPDVWTAIPTPPQAWVSATVAPPPRALTTGLAIPQAQLLSFKASTASTAPPHASQGVTAPFQAQAQAPTAAAPSSQTVWSAASRPDVSVPSRLMPAANPFKHYRPHVSGVEDVHSSTIATVSNSALPPRGTGESTPTPTPIVVPQVPLGWMPATSNLPATATPPLDSKQTSSQVPNASSTAEAVDIIEIHSRDRTPMNVERISPSPSPSLGHLTFDAVQDTASSSKEPLFLPSPSDSPMRPSALSLSAEKSDIGDATEDALRARVDRKLRPRSQVYVLVPPLPPWAADAKKQWLMQEQEESDSEEERAPKRRRVVVEGAMKAGSRGEGMVTPL